jgi:4-amino-4-deoxy-L-arabinose transferase-like glycosyltransferase
LLLWFTCPAWPLVLWALWRWRRQLGQLGRQRHLGLPLLIAGVPVACTVATPAGDRALLLALPAMACLAALALPTFKRGAAALIDWFTVLFFSAWTLIIWVVWISMQTGVPAQPAANVARLAPGFQPSFQWLAFIAALAATAAWIALARWRTGRHRTALWKSLVLPAAGATLCWLLLMTLWLPALNYARGYAPQMRQVRQLVGDALRAGARPVGGAGGRRALSWQLGHGAGAQPGQLSLAAGGRGRHRQPAGHRDDGALAPGQGAPPDDQG